MTAQAAAPIFIVGCDRSGTTLLRLMFTSHPDVEIPPEGPFIVRLYSEFGKAAPIDGDAFVRAFHNIEKCREWGLDPEELKQVIAALSPRDYGSVSDAVYQHYLASHAPSKSRWGDKNPVYVSHISLLASIFPNARFIHIVRDGRDVALSMRQHPFNVSCTWEAARYWKSRVSAGQRSGSELPPGRYTEVRYEELVSNPVKELSRLADFCDFGYSDSMLNFHNENRERELVPHHRLAWHSNTLQPVNGAGAAKWKSEMDHREVLMFQHVAGRLLERNGYDLRRGTVVQHSAIVAQSCRRTCGRIIGRVRSLIRIQ